MVAEAWSAGEGLNQNVDELIIIIIVIESNSAIICCYVEHSMYTVLSSLETLLWATGSVFFLSFSRKINFISSKGVYINL